MQDNRPFAAKMDRRISILKPDETRSGSFHERQIVWTTVLSNLPAYKSEKALKEDDGIEDNSRLTSEIQIDWEIRYLNGIYILPTWRIVDENGDTYNIISKPIEIGRRKGLSIKTRMVI